MAPHGAEVAAAVGPSCRLGETPSTFFILEEAGAGKEGMVAPPPALPASPNGVPVRLGPAIKGQASPPAAIAGDGDAAL